MLSVSVYISLRRKSVQLSDQIQQCVSQLVPVIYVLNVAGLQCPKLAIDLLSHSVLHSSLRVLFIETDS